MIIDGRQAFGKQHFSAAIQFVIETDIIHIDSGAIHYGTSGNRTACNGRYTDIGFAADIDH